MPYKYDRREASEDDEDSEAQELAEKAEEQLQDLQNRCADAAGDAERLQNELETLKKSDFDLDTAVKLADMVYGNLNTAVGVNLSDLVGCVKDAKDDLPKLETALKEVKREVKREKDETSLEIINDALDFLRNVKRELRGIEDEIAEAQESLEAAEKAKQPAP